MKAKIFTVLMRLDILLLSGPACARGGPAATPRPIPSEVPEGYETYTFLETGFSICYREKWHIPAEELAEGVAIQFYAPSAYAGFTANFNVCLHELGEPMDLPSYLAYASKHFADHLPRYTYLYHDELAFGGRPAAKHVFTWVSSGQTLKVTQLLHVEGTTGWQVNAFLLEPVQSHLRYHNLQLPASGLGLSNWLMPCC